MPTSMLSTLALADSQINKFNENHDEQGRFASGDGGGASGDKVGDKPDHTGKIPVPAGIASKGAALANTLMQADRNMEQAISRSIDVQYRSGGRGARRTGPKARKEIQEAEAEKQKATVQYRQESERAAQFKAQHGISVTHAWEAHNNRDWPNYRVNTSGEGRKHYVPKE